MAPTRPLVLVVLDGWGIRADPTNNAIAMAGTPVYDAMVALPPRAADCVRRGGRPPGRSDGQFRSRPHEHRRRPCRLSGLHPDRQDASGTASSFENPGARTPSRIGARATRRAACARPRLRGGVHSHERQLHAMVEMAAPRGVARVSVHAFLDGRDTPPSGAREIHRGLEAVMQAARHRADRVDLRPLLRDGPRQALGTRQARVRRDDLDGDAAYRCATAALRSPPRTRAANRTSSCGPPSSSTRDGAADRSDARRRRRRVHQLPGGSGARDDARAPDRRVQRIRTARRGPSVSRT